MGFGLNNEQKELIFKIGTHSYKSLITFFAAIREPIENTYLGFICDVTWRVKKIQFNHTSDVNWSMIKLNLSGGYTDQEKEYEGVECSLPFCMMYAFRLFQNRKCIMLQRPEIYIGELNAGFLFYSGRKYNKYHTNIMKSTLSGDRNRRRINSVNKYWRDKGL